MAKYISLALTLLVLIILSTLAALRVELSHQGGVNTGNKTANKQAYPYPDGMDCDLATLQGISIKRSPSRPLPQNLSWEDGLTEPEIGDPAAIKGGRVRIANAGPYPLHFCPFGGINLVFFNFTLYKNVEMQLVARHPNTGGLIPALAQSWAIDGRKVYFKLHPQARYSNGRPVRAADFLLDIYLRSSPHAQAPFALSTLQQRLEAVESIGEDYLCITLKEGGLLAPYLASELLHAAEPSFYAEFSSDYLTRYAQRVAPTTGGYTLYPEHMERGRRLVLSRVKDWWAAQLPYYRNRCNVDQIEINFLKDEALLWEFFLSKRLDLIQSRNVATWQAKTECQAVWQGQIEKRQFKAYYPFPPYGIYLNSASIPQVELRRGILAALDMDSALARIFHGEAERLSCFSDGYGAISPTDIPQALFDPQQARAHFAAQGYSQLGPDGILQNEQGQRLSYTICYTPSQKIDTLVNILSSQARSCGLELKTQALAWQQCAQLVEGKHYELAFWADVAAAPLPKLAPLFHSLYLGERGKNLHSLQDPQLDATIEAMDQAQNMEALKQATRKANLRIAQLAVWLPGWRENTAYMANWRHLRFPNTQDCQFSTATPYEVMEAHLYWIDPSFDTNGQYPEIDERIDASQQYAQKKGE